MMYAESSQAPATCPGAEQPPGTLASLASRMNRERSSPREECKTIEYETLLNNRLLQKVVNVKQKFVNLKATWRVDRPDCTLGACLPLRARPARIFEIPHAGAVAEIFQIQRTERHSALLNSTDINNEKVCGYTGPDPINGVGHVRLIA